MRLSFILIIGICWLSFGLSQPTGFISSVTIPISSNHEYYRLSIEMANNGHGDTIRFFMPSLASISVMPDNQKEYHISMNALFTLAGALLNRVFFLPQIIPNIHIQPKLYKEYLQGSFGLNTDYFLFSRPLKIFSECFVGAIFTYKYVSSGISLCIPFSRGYLKERNSYFCLNVCINFNYDEPPNQALKLTE